MNTTAPLCLCGHWEDQHSIDTRVQKPEGKAWIISPCAIEGCWCAGAGYFPVARGSRHRPGMSTHADPWPVHTLKPGRRILVTYLGDGKIGLAAKLSGSMIAEVERLAWSGEGETYHIVTDLGLIPLVKGRSNVRIVNKT